LPIRPAPKSGNLRRPELTEVLSEVEGEVEGFHRVTRFFGRRGCREKNDNQTNHRIVGAGPCACPGDHTDPAPGLAEGLAPTISPSIL
jgi:hypothetical protein